MLVLGSVKMLACEKSKVLESVSADEYRLGMPLAITKKVVMIL